MDTLIVLSLPQEGTVNSHKYVRVIYKNKESLAKWTIKHIAYFGQMAWPNSQLNAKRNYDSRRKWIKESISFPDGLASKWIKEERMSAMFTSPYSPIRYCKYDIEWIWNFRKWSKYIISEIAQCHFNFHIYTSLMCTNKSSQSLSGKENEGWNRINQA